MPADPTYYGHARREMLAFLPPRRRAVLEIGCGAGAFCRTIQGAEELWGVELDPGAAAQAAQAMKKVLVGFYEDVEADLPDGHFDVVVCNDVIEHMRDPDSFLRAIRRKLAPGGVLVGSVPNVRFFKHLFETLVLKDWHYKDEGILDRTHLKFFTMKSLARTLGETGFQVEALSGINDNLRFGASLRQNVYSAFGAALVLGTLGHARDTRFMQIAFRAAPVARGGA